MPIPDHLPKPGAFVTSDRLMKIFKCSGQGGMRRSLATNTLVIVSKHFDKQYEDRWEGEILHYTGMGLTGDQNLEYSQNKTLHRHLELGVDVHLFEQFKIGEYHYQGVVALADEPYQESQPDKNDNVRLVWMFPLKLKSGAPIPENQEEYFVRKQEKERRASQLSDQQLSQKANRARKEAGLKTVSTTQYQRDEFVASYAKRRAGGQCDLCESPAPFFTKKGEPYLECHHIVWLSKEGEDTVDNTVALCPNCHRKMHSLNLGPDILWLKARATRRL